MIYFRTTIQLKILWLRTTDIYHLTIFVNWESKLGASYSGFLIGCDQGNSPGCNHLRQSWEGNTSKLSHLDGEETSGPLSAREISSQLLSYYMGFSAVLLTTWPLASPRAMAQRRSQFLCNLLSALASIISSGLYFSEWNQRSSYI